MLNAKERTIACWFLTGAITAGYLVPGLSNMFAPYAFPSLFLLIILSLIPMGRLDIEEIFSLDARVWQVVLWQIFVLPAIILAAGHLARLSEAIIALLIATSSAGSLFASPAFAELLKLNKNRALQCMILSTFLMPLSYFFFFTAVLHSTVEIDLGMFIHRCVVFLGFPMAFFLIYMGYARCIPQEISAKIETGSRRLTIFALAVFGIGILGPARELLWNDAQTFLLYLVIITVLGAGMAYLTAIVMFRQGITDALTASIVSGFRNVGLGFMLLPSVWSDKTAAYVGISQIPIFLAPIVVNYLMRSRGAALEEEFGSALTPGKSLAST